jgi:hypothetical protein
MRGELTLVCGAAQGSVGDVQSIVRAAGGHGVEGS